MTFFEFHRNWPVEYDQRGDRHGFIAIQLIICSHHAAVLLESWVDSARGIGSIKPFTLHELVSVSSESQQSVWLADLSLASDLYLLASARHGGSQTEMKQACKYSQLVWQIDTWP